MKSIHVIGAAIILCCISTFAFGQTTQPVDQTTLHVRDVARAFAVAIDTGDVSQVRRLLADGYIGVDVAGNVMDRFQRLSQLENASLDLQSAEAGEQTVAMISQSAVVTGVYQVKGSLNGKDVSGRYRYVDVWAKTPDGWKVIASTMTKIAQ